jgi:spermidine synthase
VDWPEDLGPLRPTAAEGGSAHVKPFVHRASSANGGGLGLYFSISEIQSRMAADDPLALDLGYTRTMMGFLLFRSQPVRLMMVGLGGGSLAKFCHRYLPTASTLVAEINPHVIALRDEFLLPPDDARLTVVCADGALVVRHSASPFDVLLVDGFDSQGQPARLCSQRFYDDCHAALQPGGVLVVNLHHGHARYGIFLDRLRRSFGELLVVNDGELSNSIVFALKDDSFARFRRGPVRRPRQLEPVAAAQLKAAFALVAAALKSPARGDLAP